MGTVFCPMARVTSTAYESRNGTPPLALKVTLPTVRELADHSLAYLAQNPEQLADFMSLTGITGAALQRSLHDGSLANGLLDYVVQNEALLLAVCAQASLRPETVMQVWARHNRTD